jgi:hypothetical protein
MNGEKELFGIGRFYLLAILAEIGVTVLTAMSQVTAEDWMSFTWKIVAAASARSGLEKVGKLAKKEK